ncbi:Uncharacterised protein [Pseudomonas aeruginosa]|nr:Uncharacterised protein [Pseudomonas aeruginosa]
MSRFCHAPGLLLHLLQGAQPARVDVLDVVQEGLQVAGDHRQRRAQLVGNVGDEVLAHLLQLVDPGDVADQHQMLAVAVEGDVELQAQAFVDRRGDFQRLAVVLLVEVFLEARMADQVAHRLAAVLRGLQAEQVFRGEVPPFQVAVAVEHDHRGRAGPRWIPGCGRSPPAGARGRAGCDVAGGRCCRRLRPTARSCPVAARRAGGCAATGAGAAVARGSSRGRGPGRGPGPSRNGRWPRRARGWRPAREAGGGSALHASLGSRRIASCPAAVRHGPTRDNGSGRGAAAGSGVSSWWRNDSRSRGQSEPDFRRPRPAPCAGDGYARLRCAPRRRRCRPRPGRAVGRGYRRVPGES